MKVHITSTGTRPLLMHNIQLASPVNKYAKQMKVISSKKTKTEDDRIELARIEFEGSLYIQKPYGPYIPGRMVLACMREGAKVTKNGAKVGRGITVEELFNPLIYDGPRTAEELWEDDNFVDQQSVRVTTNRVDRTRPIFHEWQVSYDLLVDGDIFNKDEVVRIVHDAGRLCGFGDYRILYGRFVSEIDVSE